MMKNRLPDHSTRRVDFESNRRCRMRSPDIARKWNSCNRPDRRRSPHTTGNPERPQLAEARRRGLLCRVPSAILAACLIFHPRDTSWEYRVLASGATGFPGTVPLLVSAFGGGLGSEPGNVLRPRLIEPMPDRSKLVLFVGTVRACLGRPPGWLLDVHSLRIGCRMRRAKWRLYQGKVWFALLMAAACNNKGVPFDLVSYRVSDLSEARCRPCHEGSEQKIPSISMHSISPFQCNARPN